MKDDNITIHKAPTGFTMLPSLWFDWIMNLNTVSFF